MLKLSSLQKTKKSAFSSVLVLVSGDNSDKDAVTLACDLLDRHNSKLFLSYIIEVERTLPLDAEISPATARGEEVLRNMENVSKKRKCETHAELLQARRTGPAVVSTAFDKQVEAIILPIPYLKRYQNFQMGETSQYVLEHAPCEVILWRGSFINR